MKRVIRRTVMAVLASLLVVLVVNRPAAQGNTSAKAIGAKYLEFDNSFLSPENGNASIRAFVATGSLSNSCLATLGETNFGGTPTLLFCAPREPFGQKGVLISVFFAEPVTNDLILTATVYQEGAKKYDPPVLCLTSDGC